ncbi:MAG: tRNA (adenosine(37)-N6)-dimethylallyltransferase MiaA, partial [Phycisphaerae bacterium]
LQTQWESQGMRQECVFIGLRRDKADQNHRINLRATKMMDAGLVEEVRSLLAEPRPLSKQAAAAVGYAEIIRHLDGEWTLKEAFERIKINTRRLAKSQRTWQKRWRQVQWFDCSPEETPEQIAERILQEVSFR